MLLAPARSRLVTAGLLAGLASVALIAAPAADARPESSPKVRRAVFSALDSLVDAKQPDLAAAKRALRAAGVRDTDALVDAIRAGRVAPEQIRKGNYKIRVTDWRGRESDVFVYVPEGYRPDGSYGLVLLLHGLGGNGRQLLPAFFSRADRDKNVLIAPSAMKEAEEPTNEDGVEGVTSQLLKQWWDYRGGVPMAALRWAKRNVVFDPDRVILTGYSMGGFGTWNLGLRYHDRFAGIAPFAGGISRIEYTGQKDLRSRRLFENARNFGGMVFFAHGDKDFIVPTRNSRVATDILSELEIEHTYHEEAGAGHRMAVQPGGGELADKYDRWLAKPRRTASPTEVTHVALGTYAGRAYWVRIEEISDKTPVAAGQGPVSRVVAKVAGRNRIEVTAEGVSKLRVFLDPELVNVSKPVTIVVNGQTLHRGKVEASIDSVLDAWRDREDGRLVYDRSVLLDVAGGAATVTETKTEKPRTGNKKLVLY